MKFSVNTYLWTATFDDFDLDLLPRLKDYGFDGVEIHRFEFERFPVAKIRAAIEQAGLECTVCSGFREDLNGDLSLISDDTSVRQKTLSFLKQVIQITSELGATVLSGPLYAPVGYLSGRRRTSDEWHRAVEAWQSLGDLLVQSNVEIGIEPLNRFETYFINTTAEAVALCDAIDHPHVGIMFDTCHANVEEQGIAAAIRSAGHHLKHFQAVENQRGVPGRGSLPWHEIFAALHEVNYDRWCVIESFNFLNPDIAKVGCLWRDVAASPDEIAQQGIAFLKQAYDGALPQT